MTVKCLNDKEKSTVIELLQRPHLTQAAVAVIFKVSEHTIRRVVQEHKDNKVTAFKSEPMTESATAVMQLLYEHKITYEELKNMLEGTPKGILKHMTQQRKTKLSPKEHNGRQVLMFEDVQGH